MRVAFSGALPGLSFVRQALIVFWSLDFQGLFFCREA
jgi:hypothetical protein